VRTRNRGGGRRDGAGGELTAVVVGGGLAGSEAAWALAERGVRVTLHEMRPVRQTPAHQTGSLAELVCSNTFKSVEPTNAHGLLKAEMRRLGSIVLQAADEARVPGGTALAVDRVAFAAGVERRLLAHPNITVVRGEVTALPSPGIVATGPLTSDALAQAIAARLGVQSLAFYDAIAPIVAVESLDQSRMFRASRYGKGGGDDYLNAPFTQTEYEAFVAALVAGEQFRSHEFDKVPYFEGCLPVEEMAERGPETLRHGPMKPFGLLDPRPLPPDAPGLRPGSVRRAPYAVIQLRQEDRAGQMWNLVGFQTRLKIPDQQRIFRTIPGLEKAEFLRFGSIHRNSYLNAPQALTPHLSAKGDPELLFAGQLTGVEGYTESAATGLLAGINLARLLGGEEPVLPPPTTMLGALYRYLREADPAHFQPMNANFGLVEALETPVKDKAKKKEALVERAMRDMGAFAASVGDSRAEARARPRAVLKDSDVPTP
jgi:methylenetetrahydrofolate--tRNA-(uracil-5-)-methyltransferase